MNISLSVQRLPESIRRLILADPTIKPRCDQGDKLEEILRSREWAQAWLRQNGDSSSVKVLRAILIEFAGLPFELESLIKLLERTSSLTGAETRVALTKLRRSGVVFAVRKAWGEQLLYLPSDCVSLWQPLLLPIAGSAIMDIDARDVVNVSGQFRLPLSLELLSVWHQIAREPLLWTSKGTISRTDVTRMTKRMRLSAEEFDCLSLAYPQSENLPPQIAIALDLGLHNGVLRKSGNEIRISDSGLTSWLAYSPMEADRLLYAQLADRYGAVSPALHLTASSIMTLTAMKWYLDEDAAVRDGQERAINDWLELLQALGWLERGAWNGRAVFRIKQPLRTGSAYPTEQDEGQAAIFVQPDGEVLVLPEAGLRERWVLSEIAELVTADTVFVYRITRNSCMEASNAGYSKESLISFLEQASRGQLPEPVARSIEDWYSMLGKVRFAEAMLLRTENAAVAGKLRQDPETAEKLLEQVGDRDFIVDRSSIKFLNERLRKIGYPPLDQRLRMNIADTHQPELVPGRSDSEESGWIYRRHVLSVFEADRTLPAAKDLFPGMLDIPAAWITKPRTYHLSTRKELLQRAIDWQAPVQVERDGQTKLFVPVELKEDGGKWSVIGQWRLFADNGSTGNRIGSEATIAVGADEIEAVMIVLPDLEDIETN
ncbi:helicase-associated domain-containing protein [Cohnella cholangitidis]|uniref:Helicase XPB/Ssl2 N-terminal domain-containing protein n=1 Tax=Cohnella cholangitidis TaxID=2598458 RepID=A0A7G5BTJ9_9BACL|nr:helicase-associated domain-containing protein [Cohnella cholangitidis]QMV40283.1 hypothetical protein FPL14_03005 [Cohnella cholangitidis]